MLVGGCIEKLVIKDGWLTLRLRGSCSLEVWRDIAPHLAYRHWPQAGDWGGGNLDRQAPFSPLDLFLSLAA